MADVPFICSACPLRRGEACSVDGGPTAGRADCPRGFFAIILKGRPAPAPVAEPAAADASRPARGGWAAVVGTWRLAASFVRSLASGAGGERASPVVRALRVLSCHGDGEAAGVAPCPARAYSAAGRFHFCDDCGCGARELARLDAVGSAADAPAFDAAGDKLDYPYLECPRRRPGFSNADGIP